MEETCAGDLRRVRLLESRERVLRLRCEGNRDARGRR